MMYLLLNPRLSFVVTGLFATVLSFYAGAALAAYALPGSPLLQNVMMLCFFPTVTALLSLLVMRVLEAPVSVARGLHVFAFTLFILIAMVGGVYQGYATPVEGLLLGALAQGLALTVLARSIWRNN